MSQIKTPATVAVVMVCPTCSEEQLNTVMLNSELLVSDEGSELRIKAKTKGVQHVCGQLSLMAAESIFTAAEDKYVDRETGEILNPSWRPSAKACVRDKSGCATHNAPWPDTAAKCWAVPA